MDGQRPGALIAAVRDGDELEVRRFLRGYGGRRVDINQLDSFGNTPLHWAVQHDKPEILRLLIEAGAKINAVNEESQSPLLRACRLGRHDCVDLLLDADAVCTGTDAHGGTALMKAAHGGMADIIEKLADRGGQHALLDENKCTALHHAARAGHPAAIMVLVRVGAAVDQRDIQDWTPLMHAADQGHTAAIEALIECGADPLLVCDTQNTALDFAWDFEARRALRLAMKRAKLAAIEAEEAEKRAQLQAMAHEEALREESDRMVRESLRDEGPGTLHEKLRKSFENYDKDNSGSIDASEFSLAASELGVSFLSEEDLTDTLSAFDQSGDGDISFTGTAIIVNKHVVFKHVCRSSRFMYTNA